MNVVVIVQARWGSSRLPGKVLEAIGSKPALLWCLDRCALIPGVTQVVCAVPDNATDDPVAAMASDAGYMVSRGSETDVLARYAHAARESAADIVMRVTSDCPLVDPQIAGEVLRLLTESAGRIDYAANNMPPRFPHGLDCEAFDVGLLYAAEAQARDDYEREHVTPWIRRHPGICHANLRGPGNGLERMRWTLDYPQDLAFFRALADAAGEDAANWSAAQYAALCLRRPDIAEINSGQMDATRLDAADIAGLQTAPLVFPEAA